MRVMIGLSVSTGLPWQYWADQDDQVVATALDILRKARGKTKGEQGSGMAKPPRMSG